MFKQHGEILSLLISLWKGTLSNLGFSVNIRKSSRSTYFLFYSKISEKFNQMLMKIQKETN